VQSGVILGHAAMTDGIIGMVRKEVGDAPVVATGGLSGMVLPHMMVRASDERYLTLKGLNLIHGLNLT
jgi:type III pantothenate kinase